MKLKIKYNCGRNKTMDITTLADKYLTFSEESKKLLSPQVAELLIDTFNKVYPGICDFFNNGEIRNVVFEPDSNWGSPAHLLVIDDDKLIEKNIIKFNPNDIICQEEQWDIDWITHELVHVAQPDNYWHSSNNPHWINEGLADYGREKFGLYNKKAGWRIFRAVSKNKNYENGYGIAAAFFIWIEKNFYSTLSKDLNNTIKASKYNDNYFVEKTGKSVDELWQMYVDENRSGFFIWLEEYIGASLPKDMHDKIKSGVFDDELDNYLLEKADKSTDDLFILWENANG